VKRFLLAGEGGEDDRADVFTVISGEVGEEMGCLRMAMILATSLETAGCEVGDETLEEAAEDSVTDCSTG
jgi:hypothetical protein